MAQIYEHVRFSLQFDNGPSSQLPVIHDVIYTN